MTFMVEFRMALVGVSRTSKENSEARVVAC